MSYNDYESEEGDSNLEYSDDEYNSEDDEFLAFHDADIEAQVDRETWYRGGADCDWLYSGPCWDREDEEKDRGGGALQHGAGAGSRPGQDHRGCLTTDLTPWLPEALWADWQQHENI